jgi:ferredoxin-nitrite reductase
MVKVFIEHGDRTDRKKARLKHLLERWGVPRFLEETEKRLGSPLRRVPENDCEPRGPVLKHAHVGLHPQKQAGLVYAGVVLPVGRMTGAQMRGLASTAEKHGSATIRLTVWQNVLISDIPRQRAEAVAHEVEAIGLSTSASNVRAGLVACTGNRGCRYSSTDTKAHALEVARHVESRVRLDEPVNIHFTGCSHSCAQHSIGDIGLLGTKVQVGEEMAEGYHVFVGGGYGAERSLGREVYRSVPFAGVPALIERMLRAFLERRVGKESFRDFVSSRSTPELLEIFDRQEEAAAR